MINGYNDKSETFYGNEEVNEIELEVFIQLYPILIMIFIHDDLSFHLFFSQFCKSKVFL